MSPTTATIIIFKATLSTQSKDHISKDKNNDKKTSILDKANVEIITPPVPDKDRDGRAYEHERQKAKHAGAWAKRRARKTTIGGTAVDRPAGAHAGRQTKNLKGGNKVGLEVDDGYAVTPQGRESTAKMCDGLGAGHLTKVSLPPSEDGADAYKAGVKVNLSEVMMLSQKKPRKLNGRFFTPIPSMVDQLEKLKIVVFSSSGRL